MSTKIQVRRDTAANWASVNPTLLRGEIGFEYDTAKFKIGNGTSAWNSLSYSTLTQAYVQELIDAHANLTNNPHNVTKAQIGLGNVDNTSDNDKPISTATQSALDLKADASSVYTKTQSDANFEPKNANIQSHIASFSNPHNVTKTQVGLNNVPNIDATLRSNHTGTQLAATISDFTTAVQAVTIDAAKINGGVVSNTEFAYLDGVTSPIQTQINSKQPTGNYITDLTGDVTASGPGASAATLSNTGVSAGTYNSVTVDAKGRVTAGTNTGTITRYVYKTTTTSTSSNATYTTVTELTTISLPVGLYSFRFFGLMQSGSTTNGSGIRVAAGTATVTTANAKWSVSHNVNTSANNTAQDNNYSWDQLAVGTDVVSGAPPAANTTFNARGEGVFRVTSAGTVTIQIRSELNGTASSLLADSIFIMELV